MYIYIYIMIFQNISTTFCCKDRRTAASFLQQMGVRSKGSAPELLIREVTKVQGAVGFVGVSRESWVMCDWAWSLYQNSKLEWKPAAVLTAGKSMLTRLILTSLACSFRTHVAFQDSAQNSKYRSEGFWSWCGSHSHGPGLHLCGLPCGWPWIWPPFPVFATDSRTHGWGGSNLESACFPVFRLFTESMTDNDRYCSDRYCSDRYCSDRYLRSFTAGSVGIGEFNSGVNTLSVPGRP